MAPLPPVRAGGTTQRLQKEDGNQWWPPFLASSGETKFLEPQLPCDFPYPDLVVSASLPESRSEPNLDSKTPSRVSSPPSVLRCEEYAAIWKEEEKLFYAEAVAKASGEGGELEERGALVDPPAKPVEVPEMITANGSDVCHIDRKCSKGTGADERESVVLAAYVEKLKQQQQRQQMMSLLSREAKMVRAQRAYNEAMVEANACRVSQALPPKKNSAVNSGPRAVFLNNSTSKARSGTGVFHPRTENNHSCFRKKPGYSTVLLPGTVVHPLNVNIDSMNSVQPSYYQAALIPGHADGSILMEPPYPKSSEVSSPLREIVLSSDQQGSVTSHELRLPQEWTY